MIVAVYSFLSTPLGKLVGIGAAIVFAVITLVGLKFAYDASVRAEAVAEYNKTQIENSIKSNAILQKSIEEIKNIGNSIAQSVRESREANERTAEEINKKIDAAGFKDSNELAPESLRETIRQLRGDK